MNVIGEDMSQQEDMTESGDSLSRLAQYFSIPRPSCGLYDPAVIKLVYARGLVITYDRYFDR